MQIQPTSKNSFPGFPQKTLLETGNIPIEEIAELALREGHAISPLYRVHRWFARRLSSEFRAMLAALSLGEEDSSCFWDKYFGEISLDGAVVLDPFVGGGTSVVESSRCNARVIGYDIDPVATYITRYELSAAACGDLPKVTKDICTSVSEQILPFHKTTLIRGAEVDVLHHFWVEVTTCDECGHEFEVHPHYQLAYNKGKGLQWVFCKQCHEVDELPLTRKEIHCRCGARTKIHKGTISKGKVTCPACKTIRDLSLRGEAEEVLPLPRWKLFAQEYLESTSLGLMRGFKPVNDEDRARFDEASQALRTLETHESCFIPPERFIPAEGRADKRPLSHGFRRYRELFNERQLLHLTLLGKAITAVPDKKDKQLLGLAFSEHLATNCMYASYAFGYRKISPLFSIHSYRHITRPVELNPWIEQMGRNTFPKVLNKFRKAIEFAKCPSDLDPKGGRRLGQGPVGYRNQIVGNTPLGVFQEDLQAAVKTHSSVDLTDIPNDSIDLILTDPPYFDNVSYSELSDFYLAWHQVLGIAEPPYDDPRKSAPLSENLALTSRSSEAVGEYRKNLVRIFKECNRVLRPEGICVFTYHHRSAKAWLAVGEALVKSGFKCTAVVPLRGEGQGGLHSHDGTIKWDAVLVCRKRMDALSGDWESVVVPENTLKKAAHLTKTYTAKLSKNKRIGFREPDQLNLFRAFIVSSAFVGKLTHQQLSLQAVLDTKFES